MFHHATLDNGLEIIAEPRPDAHTAAVGFFVRAGSRDETPDLMGVSHFLEHMMFKGTDRRTAADVNREFDDIGAQYNAFTSQEMTVYYARVLPEHLAAAVDLFGDMLRPALRTDDFEMEKKVILEEIGMYEDQPAWRLQDALIEAHFGGHPLAHRVLGTQDTVGAMTADQMRGYFDARYGPDRITVAAAGAIDFDDLVADIESTAGAWSPTGATRDDRPPIHQPADLTLTDPKLKRHYVAVMIPGPAIQDPRRYAARVLADVIGASDGSRLYWALVDPGLADEADLSFSPYDRAGAFIGYASCDSQRADEVEAVLLATLDRAAEETDPEEIIRAAAKLATRQTLRAENPQGRMTEIGGRWAVLGDYETTDEQIERYRSVMPADVTKLAEEVAAAPRTVMRLTPGKKANR